METEEFYIKLIEFGKKYWLPLGLASLGLILFVYGLISLNFNKPVASQNFSQVLSQDNITPSITSQIAVDVEGAVQIPGVYKLNLGSIVQDGLVAAGGLSKEADRKYVSKNINLALKLTDGQKIYIPFVNEAGQVYQTQTVEGISTANALINLNSASVSELDSLPGVGLVTAQKIINARPYSSVDDLLNKKIVSAKVFTQIKDKITAY